MRAKFHVSLEIMHRIKKKTCHGLLNLMQCHSCGNMSTIIAYCCILMELYPSSSPLGSCSHGRRAGTSGTVPVAHIKEYEGCIQCSCNSFVRLFPIPSEVFSLSEARPSALAKPHHYTTISE